MAQNVHLTIQRSMGASFREGAVLGVVNMAIINWDGGKQVIGNEWARRPDISAAKMKRIAEELDHFSEVLRKLGFLLVAAAGNFHMKAADSYPCNAKGVICVGSHSIPSVDVSEKAAASDAVRASGMARAVVSMSRFSHYGPAVDILAQGEGIIKVDLETFEDCDELIEGTSFSAPRVTRSLITMAGTLRIVDVSKALRLPQLNNEDVRLLQARPDPRSVFLDKWLEPQLAETIAGREE